MRKTFIQDPVTLELVSADDYIAPSINAPMVMGDIQPYKSMINGEMIGSRSTHRAHLREHGCIEIGNETKYLKAKPLTPPPGLKDTLIRAFHKRGL